MSNYNDHNNPSHKAFVRRQSAMPEQPKLIDLTVSDSANPPHALVRPPLDPNKKPTVWVVQDNSKFNMTAASEFGEMKVLLPSHIQLQLSSDQAVNSILQSLEGFDNADSILASGDPAAIGIACAIAAAYNDGIFHIVKFDRQTNKYYRVMVDVGSMGFNESQQ